MQMTGFNPDPRFNVVSFPIMKPDDLRKNRGSLRAAG